jgi:hypothetical protein
LEAIMANDQAVEDMLTKLVEHIGETMAEVQRLSPEWTWHHVFSAATVEDDPRAPDQRTTFTPYDRGGGPHVLRMFSVALAEIAESLETAGAVNVKPDA